jgi:replicative DNA helicase
MKVEAIIDRMLCSIAGVDLRRFQSGRLKNDGVVNETKAIADAGDRLRAMPIHVERMTRLSQIVSRARRLRSKEALGLLVIDYLQLLTPDTHRAVREQEVAESSRRINELSKQLEIPIVVLSQLNRENEKRADITPRISDNRESAAVEMDADNVLLLHRTASMPANRLRIIVGKQRNGPIGEVEVVFDRARMRFYDAASVANEEAL